MRTSCTGPTGPSVPSDQEGNRYPRTVARIADAAGRVLGGRYRLLAPVGTGASARVYVAEDVRLGRRVAVKLLHTGLADDEGFLRRFRAEARAAAALTHPNIVRVYDWGEDDDGPFLVLELFGGGSLRDLLDAGHLLTPSQALVVGLEAARGLDYAHRRGLVHRDIKPANLLFDEEGRACIADFGIARALAEAAVTEPSGALMGTARYAAPEQARGISLDGRADVYALGLVLIEAVTGEVPFTADTTIGTLMARVDNDAVVPDELGPLVPAIAAAGKADPGERLDAAGFTRLLDQAANELPAPQPLPLEGRPVTTATPRSADLTEHGAPVVVASRRRRIPWKRALIAIPLVLALIGGGVALAQTLVPTHPVPRLVGSDLEAARTRAAAAELRVRVVRSEYDERRPKGTVLEQEPAPGREQKENRPVRLVVSRGPPPVGVPDIAGLTVEVATERLTGAGLVVGIITRVYHPLVPAEQVMTWAGRGKSLPKGASVDLTVSDGPEPIAVPDMSGKTFDEAAAELREHGFVPVREDVFSDNVAVGTVVGTRPAAGDRAQPRSRVTLRVSKGPEMVSVPQVVGMEVEDAKRAIVATGLQVGGVYGPPRRDRVRDSYPQPGQKVKRGSTVDLYV